jgi:citrate/tricarballylate utilization protein
MRLADPSAEGARVMAVCNACRYCEEYCPVFKAMERRLDFASADVNYLANLCHNCGECLYACQYAPPHEFAINVPQALARARVQSYERYAWPAPLGRAFRRQGVAIALLLAAAMIVLLFAATLAANPAALRDVGTLATFYAVLPHGAMVALFGSLAAFVVVALTIGARRFGGDAAHSKAISGPAAARGTTATRSSALRDVLTLRHLHASGEPCTTAEEVRTPWRRRFHHATFYGFALCFAATSVAALYHALGAEAPYAYSSLPVVLGTLGGIGLVAGPLGLLLQRRTRDTALTDAAQEGLDRAFLVLLLLAGVSGLLLLALRHHAAMGVLLLAHLGTVLALFVALPYGKFVHGIYRAMALAKHAREERLR